MSELLPRERVMCPRNRTDKARCEVQCPRQKVHKLALATTGNFVSNGIFSLFRQSFGTKKLISGC